MADDRRGPIVGLLRRSKTGLKDIGHADENSGELKIIYDDAKNPTVEYEIITSIESEIC
jgi:hypothetical protein